MNNIFNKNFYGFIRISITNGYNFYFIRVYCCIIKIEIASWEI